MDSEFENKPQDQSSENERTREGYNPAGGYQKSYRTRGRTQRPRINSHRAYSSDRSSSNSEGGFRPEGFGAGLQSTGNSERPQRSSYQSRGGYGLTTAVEAISHVSRGAISLVLSRVAIVLVTTIMMSRVVISLVSRVATSHASRAVTSLVLSRVVMATTVVVMVVHRVAAMATIVVVVMVVLSRVVMATTVAVMAVHRVVAMATTVVAVSVSTLRATIEMLSIA